MYKIDVPYLITTNDWFYGPDGQRYRSVWGYVTIHHARDLMGFEPFRPFANWYIEVKNDNQSIFIAGCQVHYSVECINVPFISEELYTNDKGMKVRWNQIYIPGK